MITPFTRAPHQGVGGPVSSGAPNAALLIDFDNVTMGMRSDLSKDLKKLLQSDIIRGKVTVQRAYADWRRYPQYIVPLSEASIDLIFAPAYGSSKKNATDIRMAIDGIELVFTRPEIGTFILLTGDSDFSSLVLKLKEYGKYVIGVGIQESSSDILVQNCDEYYSFTTVTGLRKAGEADRMAVDPWVLVEQAVAKMAERDDVMRSDRLKSGHGVNARGGVVDGGSAPGARLPPVRSLRSGARPPLAKRWLRKAKLGRGKPRPLPPPPRSPVAASSRSRGPKPRGAPVRSGPPTTCCGGPWKRFGSKAATASVTPT